MAPVIALRPRMPRGSMPRSLRPKHQREFLYQGISSRPFKRQFSLADYVQVKGAAFDNGLLQIELVREIPKAMKPRRISIAGSSASSVRQIDGKAA